MILQYTRAFTVVNITCLGLYVPDLGKINVLMADRSQYRAPFTTIYHNENDFILVFLDSHFKGTGAKTHECSHKDCRVSGI